MLPNLHADRATQHYNMLSYWQLAQMGGVKMQQVFAHVAHIPHIIHQLCLSIGQHSWCCFFIVHDLLQQNYDKNNF